MSINMLLALTRIERAVDSYDGQDVTGLLADIGAFAREGIAAFEIPDALFGVSETHRTTEGE